MEKKKKIIIITAVLLAIAAIFLIKNYNEWFGTEKSGVSAIEGVDPYYIESDEFSLDATEDFDLIAILSHNLPVVIDFGADSCVPCKEMAPVLVDLNQEFRGMAVVKFVDVWKNPDAMKGIPVRVIPTQFFFNADGTPYIPGIKTAPLSHYVDQDDNILFTFHEGGLTKDELNIILKDMGAS